MKEVYESWQRFAEEAEAGTSQEVESILQAMEELSIDELLVIWRGVADIHKRKQNELKAGFKKGDRVAFDSEQHGELTGTVVRRGGKYVMVSVRGWKKPWKRSPSSLRKIE